ncbi:MAG: 6-phosphogluconate dehydrogenase NAD-binding protein [Microbacteriaceae bacterium]|nr:6-phosphogluconate dehydrogenase NAD-binding protein [Microbacteriaceae bacterium]
MTLSVGVLGLGRMGRPIAERLAQHFVVSTHDIRVAGDGTWNPGSLDVLVSVLPGRKEVAEAMPGMLALMRRGSTWLDLGSGDPSLSRELARAAAVRSVAAVDAPMGGGPGQAESGDLRFFVGGSDAQVEAVLPLLTVLAAPGGIERAGVNAGDGQAVKLLANLLWFGQVVAVTEAFLLGQSLGIQPQALRAILPRTAGASAMMNEHLDELLAGRYAETFGLDRCLEELETLERLAKAANSPFELSGLVTRLHREALEQFGPVDGELLVAKLLENRAGRSLRANGGETTL